MASPQQLQIPQGALELIQNPQRVRDAFQLLNLLASAEVRVVTTGGTTGTASILVSGQNAVIPIPLKLATPIADSTATAASVSAQLNALLAALRVTGQLPS